MKGTTLLLGFLAQAYANIIFTHVPLKCNENSTQIYHGCLRGQACTVDGKCVPSDTVQVPFVGLRLPRVRMRAVYSTDGTCGPNNGNTICDPNSTAYTGGCCSQYGWCGNTNAHCGAGCISGCTPATTGTVPPRTDGRCGQAYGNATCDPNGEYGGCCSAAGYCGTTSAHCLVSQGCQNGCVAPSASSSTQPSSTGPSGSTQSSAASSPSTTPVQASSTAEPVIQPASTSMGAAAQASAPVTTDGSCGAGNNDTVCGNWPNGACCSLYGFCGSTSAHCGAGCQSGPCVGPPAVPAPGPSPAPANAAGLGKFTVVGDSGVPAMHAALLPNGRVMFLDKLENFTKLKLSSGRYAMSAEYNPATNAAAAPLAYMTNAFCAGGTFLADGRVVSLGGNGPLDFVDPTIGNGFNAIRWLSRSPTDASLNGKDWVETSQKLASNRWYASAQTMPDGSVFVASGSLNGLDPTVLANNNPTYEILNRDGTSRGTNYPMLILNKTQPYYMYPFLHLLSDGTVFVFASKSSQIFNVGGNSVVKSLPDLVGDYRTYPNTGGSVLLPLSSSNNYQPDIVICGGGAYQDITSPTDASCGRIQPLGAATWELDSMPEGRGMVEGTLLPDGTVLWLNGGDRGAQGFGLMSNPTLEALLYDPTKAKGQRWTTLAQTTIPRLYHSVAILLLDGTVMVTGSNPVEMPKLVADQNDPYVTEFRVEIFTPPYRLGAMASLTPTKLVIAKKTITPGAAAFSISFSASTKAKAVKVVLHHGGFITHSLHMGQRMVQLDTKGWVAGAATQKLQVTPPPNHNITPPGPYVFYVVVDGVPSVGQFVSIA